MDKLQFLVLICIEPTGLRLRHIGKTDPPVWQSNSVFTRAASLAQLVLTLGPSPRPWPKCWLQLKNKFIVLFIIIFAHVRFLLISQPNSIFTFHLTASTAEKERFFVTWTWICDFDLELVHGNLDAKYLAWFSFGLKVIIRTHVPLKWPDRWTS